MTTILDVKTRPILFSAPMIRAILEGRKTQTRRVVKDTGFYAIDASIHGEATAEQELKCLATEGPYGVPGDHLWVRETWATMSCYDHVRPCNLSANSDPWYYRADGEKDEWDDCERWRPSIFMPRNISRIDLEITGIRVERLTSISEADAIAEGATRRETHRGDGWSMDWSDVGKPSRWASGVTHEIPVAPLTERDVSLQTARTAFGNLWEKIHGDGSWDADPWVFVISFKRIKP